MQEQKEDFNPNDPKYIIPWQNKIKEVAQKLGIKKPIKVKINKFWRFHIPKNESFYLINSPPYHPYFEPVFIHYLCHAKILENGWPRFDIRYKLTDYAFKNNGSITKEEWVKKPLKERKKIFFGWTNRSADTFFDLYVWSFLIESFGNDYFLRFTEQIPKHTEKDIIKGLKNISGIKGFNFSNYNLCTDWFAMLYTVSKRYKLERANEIDILFSKLIKNKEFFKLIPNNFESRIRNIRKFYDSLLAKHPDYKSFLKDKGKARQIIKDYYSIVWHDTGLDAEMIDYG